MYADNTNVTFSAHSAHHLELQFNTELKHINLWLKANKVKSQCRLNKVCDYYLEAETADFK